MGLMGYLTGRFAKRIGPEHRQFVAMTGSVLDTGQATCPRCRRGHLKPDPDALDMRVCDNPKCGVRLAPAEIGRALAVSGTDFKALAAHERRQAMLLFLAAEVSCILAAAWAVYSGSWMTLFGAVMLGIVLCANAMLARYRAWQLENGRMFEARAPIGAFLAAELGRGKRQGR